MPDRLDALLRQRALLREHLAWLEREIAAASAPTAGGTPGRSPPIPTLESASRTGIAATGPAPNADAILDRYRPSPGSLQSDVRKGCFLYFAAAFVFVGLGVAALYFLIGRH